MKKYLYISITAVALTLASCNDFLDKQPSLSQNAPVTDAEQLLAVYDNTTHLYTTNYQALFGTDNYEITREHYDADPSEFRFDPQLCYYLHYRDGLINSNSDDLWTSEYAKIYDANLIVESAGSVAGSEATINEALAGAYLMRAYSYHVLATTYCMPWSEANKESLGVPQRLKLDYEENLSRGTLEQTWNQIFADMEAAQQHVSRQAPDADMPWRVSQCAIDAMYARLYLCYGDYDKALEHTNKALATAPALLDYNSLVEGRPAPYPAGGAFENADTLWYSELNDWPSTKYYRFPEFIFPRFTQNSYQWCVPAKSLVDSYDHNTDLRFKWLCLPHGNRRMNAVYDAYRFCMFDDGRFHIEGPSTPELLLNKAEILVRKGQWQEGLQTLQPLYAARHSDSGSFTASSQAEALKVVLAERRREFPFSFIRMMDIQRYGATDTPDDDVIVRRDFYEVSVLGVDDTKPKTYTLDAKTGGMVCPIYMVDIVASQGAIEQNPE